jgi:hypothetical protein
VELDDSKVSPFQEFIDTLEMDDLDHGSQGWP